MTLDAVRRIFRTSGRIRVPLGSLNPGQQCALRHSDGRWYYPYIVVKQDACVLNNRIEPNPGTTVVKLESAFWFLSKDAWCYVVDSITEDIKT